MIDRAEAERKLRQHGQEHVLRFYDRLDAAGRSRLLADVAAIDLRWLDRVFALPDGAVDPSLITPYGEVIRQGSPREAEALDLGRDALRAGRVGVLLVAGGQGTRLGFDGPKGAYALGAVSRRTLFQIHAEWLRGLGRRFGSVPPLYLMTSPANHEATCRFFADNHNFGLPPEQVMIFEQGLAPAVDEQGKLLLASPDRLVLAPNGNGGLFAALADAGALAQMTARGVDTISYIQVDNALARGADPRFVGHHLLAGAEFSCKAIAKTGPLERVGNFARIAGKLGIVEYTEIPARLAEATDDRGELLFGHGNPGLFTWSRAFIERQARRRDLPYHKAHKKIAHIDDAGERVHPSAPNGYKLESFALDTLLDAEPAVVVECDRDEEFAPVKNATGTDSPESARSLMTRLYRRWIEQAGARVVGEPTLEVSPLFALDAEELGDKLESGRVFDRATYLS